MISRRWWLWLTVCLACVLRVAPARSGIPLAVTLAKPAYVTLVIEDARGNRVRNLLSDTKLPAGRNLVTWDGYDEGEHDANGDIVRHKVAPGVYHLRGLTHDGLKLRYEFSVYSPGTPPWFTLDNTGAWLCDHTPPADVIFLPANSGSPYGKGQPNLLVASNVSEAGQSLMWLDLNGRKLHGQKIGWMGGKALARDTGPRPNPDYYAYTVFINAGLTGEIVLHGLKPNGSTQEISKYRTQHLVEVDGFRSGVSVAVRDGLAVVSVDVDNALLFIDTRTRQLIGTAPLTKPRGVAFDADGTLLAVTDGTVQRFKVSRAAPFLGQGTPVISTGLEDPRRVYVAPDGALYVSDWGSSHQVKVFSADGRLVRALGTPGGLQLGKYDELHMQHPLGMTLDDQGRLWVCEDEFLPKRISLWNAATGAFLRAWYGGPQYGGGGRIDPRDPTRFYYSSSFNFGSRGLMEFKLDWKTGASRLAYINYRGEEPTEKVGFWDLMFGMNGYKGWDDPAAYSHPMPCDDIRGAVPDCPVYLDGHQYMVNSFKAEAGANSGGGIWMMDKDHVIWPVAMISGAETFEMQWAAAAGRFTNLLKIRDLWKTGRMRQTLVVWSDLNHNHYVDPEEIQITDVNLFDKNGIRYGDFDGDSAFSEPDLALTYHWGLHLPAPTFDTQGMPIYDIKKLTKLADIRQRGNVEVSPSGWFLNRPYPGHQWSTVVRGYRNGVERWHYLGYSTESLPQFPGQLMGAGRVIGPVITPKQGQAGEVLAYNGGKGEIYLLTTDGLFLDELGGDMRTTPLWRMPDLKRGDLLPQVSFEDEHFHPSINQLDDGRIYLVAGKEHSSILRVEGWESIRRQDFGTVTVTAQALVDLPETQTQVVPHTYRKLLTGVALPLPPSQRVADWTLPPAAWADIDNRASGAIVTDGTKLYVAYRTGDEKLLTNACPDYRFLFKYGGALDLMLGTNPEAPANRQAPAAGDLRLLVTRVNGAKKAVLYRPVVPGTPGAKRVLFNSPIGAIYFDEVRDISDQVQLWQQGGDYLFAVPLQTLGLTPGNGRDLLADVGILRGNGAQTVQRVYWNNLNTSVVSDIPSEARLQPGNWGTLRIQASAGMGTG